MANEGDEHLNAAGPLDAVIWASGELLENDKRKITFIFKEMVDDKRVTISLLLVPNQKQDSYSCAGVVPDELTKRGVESVEVAINKDANTSTIQLKLNGESVEITKDYS